MSFTYLLGESTEYLSKKYEIDIGFVSDYVIRVVVSYMGKNYFRNFLAPNPGICEVPGENLLGEIIFESDHIYPVLNDLEVSRNVV